MLVSIAICTWNRAPFLDQTLAAMCRLRIPAGVTWELLVVNNNCTDNTNEVVARHAPRLPVRLLSQPVPGKSHAANLVLAEARGELILWTDDDVLVDPDWLTAYVEAARQWPEAAYFGGTVEPLFAHEPPAWIRRHLHAIGKVFSIRLLGDAVRRLEPGENPAIGANMAFRAAAFKGFAFDSRLGPKGNDFAGGGGEEKRLLAEVMAAGGYGVWVGPARVKHYIPPERLTRRYVWERHQVEGRVHLRQNCLPPGKCLWGVPRWVLRKFWQKRLLMWCLSPFKSERWLRALQEAAFLSGLIQEYRVQHQGAPGVRASGQDTLQTSEVSETSEVQAK